MPDLNHDWLLGSICGFAGGCVMAAVFWQGDAPPQKGVESPRFEVVDNYKGCDVVRYEVYSMATYQYFLDCSEKNDN